MRPEGTPVSAVVVRAAGFLVLWLILAGCYPGDIPAAVVAVAAATWASLRLLPPGTLHLSPLAIGWLALRFPVQSLVAGIDVAWRALHPRLPLRIGTIAYEHQLPPGIARDAFCAYASLMPGTLPADTDAHGRLLVHCLDTDQPVATQLAREEALFARALDG